MRAGDDAGTSVDSRTGQGPDAFAIADALNEQLVLKGVDLPLCKNIRRANGIYFEKIDRQMRQALILRYNMGYFEEILYQMSESIIA